MEKIFITNRKGQKLVILLDRTENQKGLAFVVHGLGGNKEEPHIATFAQAFKEKGFTVVRFDTTNTFGESDGNYENATVTSHFSDLEDVIAWAKMQEWYQEPFYLSGHSSGGISVILYAEKHPYQVKGLAPISTVLSGELSIETDAYKDVVAEWKKTGWLQKVSKNSPTPIRLPWSHMEDRLQYDVLKDADNLTMPVLMIVGSEDRSTPLEHQQLFFDALSREKELHVIKGSPHVFLPEHLGQIKEIFKHWIEKAEA